MRPRIKIIRNKGHDREGKHTSFKVKFYSNNITRAVITAWKINSLVNGTPHYWKIVYWGFDIGHQVMFRDVDRKVAFAHLRAILYAARHPQILEVERRFENVME